MSDNMGKSGLLSLIKLSSTEVELFLDYLQVLKNTYNYDIIYVMLGDDFLKFLDIFSGEVFKVPSRREVIKIVEYVKVYSFCEKRKFSEESIGTASKVFARRKSSVKRIINKINKVKEKFNKRTEVKISEK